MITLLLLIARLKWTKSTVVCNIYQERTESPNSQNVLESQINECQCILFCNDNIPAICYSHLLKPVNTMLNTESMFIVTIVNFAMFPSFPSCVHNFFNVILNVYR